MRDEKVVELCERLARLEAYQEQILGKVTKIESEVDSLRMRAAKVAAIISIIGVSLSAFGGKLWQVFSSSF